MTVANAMISLVGEQTQDQTLSAQLVPASSVFRITGTEHLLAVMTHSKEEWDGGT